MAIRIMFDAANNPEAPTVVLAKRDGGKLGQIDARSISVSDSFNDAPEMSFTVYKELNGKKCELWDEITNFKLIYCVEWNEWFEITVELDESNETVKTVFATGLGYAELGQIMLYDIEINTEDDIARDDYKEPTVLFNEKNPKASLLNRIMEKAPHYTITHVDNSIAGIQRTFSFNDISIVDAFQDIAEEIKCIFVLNAQTDGDGKLRRTVEVYDLQNYCFDCKHRWDSIEQNEVCPECGSENVKPGYGEDTTIFITSDELADDIGFETDTDAVKNCFKLEGGDDLMTATIRNCNPNGTDYLWYFSDDMKHEMPSELVDKIEEYDELYKYYQDEHIVIQEEIGALNSYNQLVNKYRAFNEDLEIITAPIKGYPALMNAYYNTIDFDLYLTSSMMPSVETMETDAKKELAKLTSIALSPVAVKSVSVISNATADNVVLSMARLIVDTRFKVKINSSTIENNGGNTVVWTGSFIVTNYYEEEDTATGSNVTVIIDEDYERFIKQKIEQQLSKDTTDDVDIVSLFEKDYDSFVNELRKFSLNRLKSFQAACQAVLDILIEQGIADKETWSSGDVNLYDDLYMPYMNKMDAIMSEAKLREQEIQVISGKKDADGDVVQYGLQNYLDEYRDEIQDALDFEKYLGEEMWLNFCAYRREDKYSNDNFISDALNNKEIFERAQEFIELATQEIHKSAEQQHSISSDLKNLLVIDKFKPLVDSFSVGNWLRIMVDDTLYKLRLINYSIDYDSIESIEVEFSDVIKSKDSASDIQSVLEQAQSMATSYGSVKRQAADGKNTSNLVGGWVSDGLDLTNMSIVGNAENQNIEWGETGLLAREYLPITDTYDDRQLKLINRGLYVTDDGWLTARAGIGNFMFWNPKTKETEEAYGVIADTIVGNIILSEEVGIYNKNASITLDDNGFSLTTNADGSTPENIFLIQKELKDQEGNLSYDKMLYIDSDGNLTLNGNVNISSDNMNISTLDGLRVEVGGAVDAAGNAIDIANSAIKDVDIEYASGTSNTVAPENGWSTDSPKWESGKYIWQRTKTVTPSGEVWYSDPVCIQGAKGQDGINGTDGKDGVNGTSSYFHVAYANSADGSKDFSTTESANKQYIGTYVDNTPSDSGDHTKYSWTLIKGADGKDGIAGTNGKDGTTYYLHIAYANSADGSEGFSTIDGANKKYIGQCVNTTQADPNTHTSYTWSLFKGADGTNGLPGRDGIDGTSTYVHIKYAPVMPSASNPQISDTPNKYIGICTDNNEKDPTTWQSYTWSKLEGTDGTNGLPGKNGEDGTSSYVHFAYSTSADGKDNFSTTSFNGALYIGVLTNSTQKDSDKYTDYTWSRMRGEDGRDGAQGIPGVSSYVHIKYSAIANPTLPSQISDTPNEYIGICTDNNEDDPADPGPYTWSKFEGRDGKNGIQGPAGKDGTSSYVHFAYSTTADGSGSFNVEPFDGAKYIGVLTNSTKADSTNYKDYTWSLMKGEDGTGIDTIYEQYYLSTSATTQTGGQWLTDEQPQWQAGHYIWTRSKILWDDGSTTYTDPVLAKALNEANENAIWVRSYMTYDASGLTVGKYGDPAAVRMSSSGTFQVRLNERVATEIGANTMTFYDTSSRPTFKVTNSAMTFYNGSYEALKVTGSNMTFKNGNTTTLNVTGSTMTFYSGGSIASQFTGSAITFYRSGSKSLQIDNALTFYNSGRAIFQITATEDKYGTQAVSLTSPSWSSIIMGGLDNKFSMSDRGVTFSTMYNSFTVNGTHSVESLRYPATGSLSTSYQKNSFNISLSGDGLYYQTVEYIVIYYQCHWGDMTNSIKVPLSNGTTTSAYLYGFSGQTNGTVMTVEGITITQSGSTVRINRNVTTCHRVSISTGGTSYRLLPNGINDKNNQFEGFTIDHVAFCG